jgi:ribosomal protein L24E
MGQWQELNTPWWETNVRNCGFCGQMIPRRMWIVEDEAGGPQMIFCGPDCEALYRRYWVPRHGKELPKARGREGS